MTAVIGLLLWCCNTKPPRQSKVPYNGLEKFVVKDLARIKIRFNTKLVCLENKFACNQMLYVIQFRVEKEFQEIFPNFVQHRKYRPKNCKSKGLGNSLKYELEHKQIAIERHVRLNVSTVTTEKTGKYSADWFSNIGCPRGRNCCSSRTEFYQEKLF